MILDGIAGFRKNSGTNDQAKEKANNQQPKKARE